jgi:ABC-type antimicrobial peptide transport system permease subunit
LVILHRSQEEKMIALRLPSSSQKGAKTKEILSAIEKEWLTWFPATRFHYNFLNDSLESLYGQEKRSAWLVNMAMIIAVFISCMGIFGLGMWTAEKRAKEIGIRKVLGASVASITALLTKDFVILIIIALVIASPLSWYCLNQWLMDFAFRITIGAWVFVVAGLSAILIAIITISFQAVKAAVANPVEALRTE